MAETGKLGLPLLEGGQAQKHVTVNEALLRIDALSQPTVTTRDRQTPPDMATEGELHIVGPGGVGDWLGRDGLFALRSNGGWDFAAPSVGQRIWLAEEAAPAVFDGVEWLRGDGAVAHGACTTLRIATLDHEVGAGATSTTAAFLPDKAIVLGVTARVLATLTGPGLTGWRLGAPGDHGRYGAGYGLAAGAFAAGVTGSPIAYYGGSPLVLEAEGGVFESGAVRLCAHYIALTPPRA